LVCWSVGQRTKRKKTNIATGEISTFQKTSYAPC
jgi:hypothetical protein